MPYKNAFIVPEKASGLVDDSPVDCHEEKPVQFEDGTLTIPDGNQSFDTCQDMTEIVRVVIPSSLKSIKADAFKGCSGLEEVHISSLSDWCEIEFENEYSNPLFYAKNLYLDGEIVNDLELPSGLKSVGDFAFVNCDGIVSLTIPNGIENFGRDIFLGCTGVKKITYNGSATEWKERNVVVPSKCTVYCTSGILQNKPAETPSPKSEPKTDTQSNDNIARIENGILIIPNNVTDINDELLDECNNLEGITVEKGNLKYHSEGNCLIETESKTLILGCKRSKIPENGSVIKIGDMAFYDCNDLIEIAIPDGITDIGSESFRYCAQLTNITISDSVTNIDNEAFSDCTALNRVKIGENVNCIGDGAFSACTSLTSIIIPDSVTYIGSEAFSDCVNLKNVVLPKYITSIEDDTFNCCDSLPNITIPNGVTSIGNLAFYHCTELTNIIIPSSVTEIGSSAFQECEALVNITITNNMVIVGDGAFYDTAWYGNQPDGEVYMGKILYCYNGIMPKNTSIKVKPGTITISAGAFDDCDELVGITIPDSITELPEDIFADCINLKEIIYHGTEHEWVAMCVDVPEECTVYCLGENQIDSTDSYDFLPELDLGTSIQNSTNQLNVIGNDNIICVGTRIKSRKNNPK